MTASTEQLDALLAQKVEFDAWMRSAPDCKDARTLAFAAWQAARRAQVVLQFSQVAKQKLNYLLEAGEEITGYAIQNKDGRRGAIDCHGFVYWWQDAAAPQPQEAACNPSMQPELVPQPLEPKGWREALQAVCMDMVAVGNGQHVISDEARAKVEALQAELFQKAAPANQPALTESEAAALAAVYLPVSRQADGVALIRAMERRIGITQEQQK